MAGVVLVTIIVSGWFVWRLLWPPIPSDRGLAAMQAAFPESDVACLLTAIEREPARFFVDDSFYFEPQNGSEPHPGNVFFLRDRDNRHSVSFSTERQLSYYGFYGQTGSVPYGPC